MSLQTGNLSPGERIGSAILAVALPALLFRRRNPLLRAVAGAATSALVARAVAGHCGVKSAMAGHTSLRQGLWDQWKCLLAGGRESREGLPGSPAHQRKSHTIDQAIDESFPASDPPGSQLPDEPPANAAAKWAAAARAKS